MYNKQLYLVLIQTCNLDCRYYYVSKTKIRNQRNYDEKIVKAVHKPVSKFELADIPLWTRDEYGMVR